MKAADLHNAISIAADMAVAPRSDGKARSPAAQISSFLGLLSALLTPIDRGLAAKVDLVGRAATTPTETP